MNATPEAPPPTPAPAPARPFGKVALGLVVINALFVPSLAFAYGGMGSPTQNLWWALSRTIYWLGVALNQRSNFLSGVIVVNPTVPPMPLWKLALPLLEQSMWGLITLASFVLILLGLVCSLRICTLRSMRWFLRAARIHAVAALLIVGCWLTSDFRSDWSWDRPGIHGLPLLPGALAQTIIEFPGHWFAALTGWRSSVPDRSLHTLWLLLFTAEFLLCTRVLRRMRSAEGGRDSAPA